MIRGRVVAARDDGTGLEPRIPLDILGGDGAFRSVSAVVDTGFTGALTLPEPIVSDLDLHRLDDQEIVLADGRKQSRPTCRAELLWHGQPITLRAYMMGNHPMIGTALLSPCRLAIDLWLGGGVIITETPPPRSPATA